MVNVRWNRKLELKENCMNCILFNYLYFHYFWELVSYDSALCTGKL